MEWDKLMDFARWVEDTTSMHDHDKLVTLASLLTYLDGERSNQPYFPLATIFAEVSAIHASIAG